MKNAQKRILKTVIIFTELELLLIGRKVVWYLKIKFLGFVLNSETMTIEVSIDKRLKIKSRLDAFRRNTIARFCLLYTKGLKRTKFKALYENEDNYEAYIEIPKRVFSDLTWGKNNIKFGVNEFVTKINTNIFKAHSTRYASTSAAHRKGPSWNLTRKSAGWKETSLSFAKFYNRPLAEKESLLETVFNIG